MNLLMSCIGKRGYIADYFRQRLGPGDRIIGTSHTYWTIGFEACDERVVLPPIASPEYLPAVIATCRRFDIDALMSFYDPDVAMLSIHRAELELANVVPFVPGARTVEIAYDKWNTYTELTRLGYLVPESMIDLDQVFAALRSGSMSFPLVVKPRCGFGSANTFIARNELQLRAFFEYAPDMLVQQFIEGSEFNASILADMRSRPLAVVPCHKRLMAGGETQQAVTVEHPELLEVGCRLAADLELIGPLDVDVLQAPDGRMFVIDLNPRFGGTYPIAHMAGADFPKLMLEMAKGGSPAPRIGDYQRNICMLKGIAIMGGPADQLLNGVDVGACT